MKRILPVAALLLLGACSTPSTTVRSVDNRPGLVVLDTAPGAILVLDGRVVGPALAFSGQPDVLRLEPGTHEVEIRDASGRVTYRQTVFVESEIKTIRVH